VRCSSKASSGWRCRSRRNRTTKSRSSGSRSVIPDSTGGPSGVACKMAT
jgi:hypothetical protein